MKITERDYLKAHRRASRQEEIAAHSHPISLKRVHKSKKVYDRKKIKADDKGLLLLCPNLRLFVSTDIKVDHFG